MMGKLGVPELLILLAIVLMIFGPSKIAGIGRSLGEAIQGFKSAVKKDPAGENPEVKGERG